ncbi:MAG: hypothetical protein MUQ65_16745 [Armatimonadetes bacterium]|nr:hypothetical protein [Armatimonadota bacterium]
MTPLDDTGGIIHPMIQREINAVSVECENRHRRSGEEIGRAHRRIDVVAARLDRRDEIQSGQLSEHRDRLVEISGISGEKGRLGVIMDNVAEAARMAKNGEAMAAENKHEISKMKLSQFRWGAGGAAAGGGTLFGIVEIVRHYL